MKGGREEEGRGEEGKEGRREGGSRESKRGRKRMIKEEGGVWKGREREGEKANQ